MEAYEKTDLSASNDKEKEKEIVSSNIQLLFLNISMAKLLILVYILLRGR